MLPRKSNGRASGVWIVTENVTKDFVQDFGLNGFLDKMLGALLQRGQNVFLITDGGDHDDAGVGMLPDDALDGFNALHLGHGDVHENDVGLDAVELGNGREAVARFAGDFTAEDLDHLHDVLAGEDGIVHHEITDRLLVLAK